MNVKIGTRGSKLALWQAKYVRKRLAKVGIDSEIVTIETKGDKILDVTISKIGSKGVFTEEIEDQLASGDIDIAVHSAKDMPSTLPDNFELIAFSKRERAHDVLISHRNIDLSSRKLVLGTSSTRRIAFLEKHYPHVKTVAVRGNLQTRIRKMEEGACDALWLAYAGVHRMKYDHMVVHEFDPEEYIPAVGQGSVAIEVHQTLSDEKKSAVRQAINHTETETCLLAERSFLKVMNGGCSIPVFGMAQIHDEVLTIKGGIISLDGEKQVSKSCSSTLNAGVKAGQTLAEYVLNHGGKEILDDIRKQQSDNE